MGDRVAVVERWGFLAGVTGTVANVLLAGLYVSLGTGDTDFRWTGPANDVMGGLVSSTAGIVFVRAVADVVDAGPGLRLATRAAVVGQAAVVGSTALLVADVMPFEAQVWVAVPGIVPVFVWALVLGSSRRLPGRLSRAATAIGAAACAGLGLGVGSLLLPAGSLVQYVVGGAGVLVGIPAFLAYPLWQVRLSLAVREHAATRRPDALLTTDRRSS